MSEEEKNIKNIDNIIEEPIAITDKELRILYVTYGLTILGLLGIGSTIIIVLIMNLILRSKGSVIARSHHSYLAKTNIIYLFAMLGIGLTALMIGMLCQFTFPNSTLLAMIIVLFIGLGLIGFISLIIWYIYRIINGLLRLLDKEACN